MQANWTLILNFLLLIGVVLAILRLVLIKRKKNRQARYRPVFSKPDLMSKPDLNGIDDVIAVRKVQQELDKVDDLTFQVLSPKQTLEVDTDLKQAESIPETQMVDANSENERVKKSIMMFLLAKENRSLAGYELLQTVLSVGLRFGDGHLFHRHQHANGQGPVICSLAAATPTGVFDLQNIGAFSVRGLCLFMHASGSPSIDTERFTIMLETAAELTEELDTHLLDERQRPLNREAIERYCQRLNIKNAPSFNECVELI